MISTPYVFHADPGHGWLAVPLADADRLGILPSISHYSHIDESTDTLYLEAHADATLFANLYEQEFGHPVTEVVGPDVIYQEQADNIRNLPYYDAREYSELN
jgi:hypothetical protein